MAPDANHDNENETKNKVPSQFEVIKAFPPRFQLQQFRLASATDFSCARCETKKKSKLIAVEGGDWDKSLCNGCYGALLAKSGTK